MRYTHEWRGDSEAVQVVTLGTERFLRDPATFQRVADGLRNLPVVGDQVELPPIQFVESDVPLQRAPDALPIPPTENQG